MSQDNHKSAFLKALMQHGQTLQMYANGSGQVREQGAPTPVASPAAGAAPLSGPTSTSNTSPTNSGAASLAGNTSNLLKNVTPLSLIPGVGGAIDQTLGGLFDMGTNKFQATGAPIQPGTNTAQLNAAYGQTQAGLQNQANFVSQLQGQNGIANQSNIYGQFGNVAAGQGPNPAQAMLANATGANVAQQAALMAGQRGAGANTGLIARQAAQQGAATQQQAAGQAAALQAQQSLNALGTQAGIAQNQVNQLGQATTGFNTAAQNEQNILQNANAGYNSAQVNMQSNLNNVNGQISQGNQSAANGFLGNLMGGGAISSLFAEGGEVGEEAPKAPDAQMPATSPVNVGTADVGTGSFTAPTPAPSANPGSMGTSPDMGAAFKSNGGGGGGKGGGGGIMGLMALAADGGATSEMPKYNLGANTDLNPMPAAPAMHMAYQPAPLQPNSLIAPPPQPPPQPSQTHQSGVGKFFAAISGNKQPGAQNQHGIIGQWLMSQFGGSQPNPGPVAPRMQQSPVQSYNQREDQYNQYLDRSQGHTGADTEAAHQFLGKQEEETVPDVSPSEKNPFTAAKGGRVPALVSPGEQYLPPKDVKKVTKDGKNPLAVGERIPGTPKHPGNDYRNDTVPKTLKEGGIVIPNSIMQSKSPAKNAMKFVEAHMAKNKGKLPKKGK